MAVTGQSVINSAVLVLKDATHVRWSTAELVSWLNAAQREVVIYKPEATAITEALQLSAGDTRQALPANYRLLDIVRNMGADGATPGRAIRFFRREDMDRTNPLWHVETSATAVREYTFDVRNPHYFYVSPPPSAAIYVDAVVSVPPTDLTATGDVVVGDLDVDDTYANAVLDYVLYRAYVKDGETPGNASRAVAHYQAFANAVGLLTKADVDRGPMAFSPFMTQAAGG